MANGTLLRTRYADSLGSVLSRLRQGRGLRIKDVAESTGFSSSYISQVERGKVVPSVGALNRFAQVFGVTLSEIFSRLENSDPVVPVVRANERRKLLNPGSQFKNQLLAPDFKRRMEPILSRAKPGAVSAVYSHDGEEFVFVLKGKLVLRLDDREYELTRGDAAYFDSRRPHRWANGGQGEVWALFVITPPTW